MHEEMTTNEIAPTEGAPAEVQAAAGERTPPGRKRCANCGALNGVRTARCGCGFAFPVKEKAERTPRAAKPGRTASAGAAGDDPFARVAGVCEEIAAFCRSTSPAALEAKVHAVAELAGRLTPEEHAQIVRLSAMTGGYGTLLLLARELASRGEAQAEPAQEA